MGVISYLKEEVQVIEAHDPAFHSPIEILLYPGFKALLYYRFAHRLYMKEKYFWEDGYHNVPQRKQVLKYILVL